MSNPCPLPLDDRAVSQSPFRLLDVGQVYRVCGSLTADVAGVGAFVALSGQVGEPAAQSAAPSADAVGILLLHPDACAGAVMTADQADALAATLRTLAAEVRAEAFNAATNALREAARD